MSRFQTLYDQAVDVLKDMEESVPSIDFSLLTYADGRILATTLREEVDQELIACAETMAFCISSNLSNLLTGGKIEKLVISGKDGSILIQGVGRHTILSIAIKKASSTFSTSAV
ncbi:MAG: roadblock/LC7 domain-containing protein [Candidatus Freyarchaeota archaeon]